MIELTRNEILAKVASISEESDPCGVIRASYRDLLADDDPERIQARHRLFSELRGRMTPQQRERASIKSDVILILGVMEEVATLARMHGVPLEALQAAGMVAVGEARIRLAAILDEAAA